MLSAEDVRNSDLKDEVKLAQKLVSERTKFMKQFIKRRAARQQRAVSKPPEDLEAMARSMLPSDVGIAVVETQAMRDYATFHHLRGAYPGQLTTAPHEQILEISHADVYLRSYCVHKCIMAEDTH